MFKLIVIAFRIENTKLEFLLDHAFGERCQELGYPIKLSVQGQEILLATDQALIEPDGRLKLSPFSVAVFKKFEA